MAAWSERIAAVTATAGGLRCQRDGGGGDLSASVCKSVPPSRRQLIASALSGSLSHPRRHTIAKDFASLPSSGARAKFFEAVVGAGISDDERAVLERLLSSTAPAGAMMAVAGGDDDDDHKNFKKKKVSSAALAALAPLAGWWRWHGEPCQCLRFVILGGGFCTAATHPGASRRTSPRWVAPRPVAKAGH